MNALRKRGAVAADAGFTIVELLVAMVITGLVLAIAGAFFANIAKLTSWSGSSRDATGQSALALDAIRSVIRVAADNPTSPTATDPAVLVATPSTLTLTAYSNTSAGTPTPVEVTFTMDAGGRLLETRQPGTSTSGYWVFTGNSTRTVIATGFSTAPSTPLFGYVNASGALMSPGSALSSAQRSAITYVRVTTTVNGTDAGGSQDPVVVTTSVGMPNLSRNVAATISVPNLPTPVVPTPIPTPTPAPSSSSASPSPTTSAGGGSSGSSGGAGTGSGTPSTGTGGSGGTGGGGTGTTAPSSTPSSTPRPTTTTSSPPPPSPPAPPAPPKNPVVG